MYAPARIIKWNVEGPRENSAISFVLFPCLFNPRRISQVFRARLFREKLDLPGTTALARNSCSSELIPSGTLWPFRPPYPAITLRNTNYRYSICENIGRNSPGEEVSMHLRCRKLYGSGWRVCTKNYTLCAEDTGV